MENIYFQFGVKEVSNRTRNTSASVSVWRILRDGINNEDTHCWGVGGPAGRTHLTMGLHELERLHQAKGLFDTPAHWKVVHAHVLHHAAGVDDEQAPEGQ